MRNKQNGFVHRDYVEEGFSGPISVMDQEAARRDYERFFTELGQDAEHPEATTQDLSAWHHRHAWAYDLATSPLIVTAMQDILGPDLVLWAMHFWYKEPGNPKSIPWHQDINYWPMEPAINATAWVSLGDSFTDNGCLRLIPGTHRDHVQHVALHDANSLFADGLPAEAVDESRAIDVEMTPGEAVFFNEAIVHGSNPNRSLIPRVAFSVRYTTPEVRFRMEEWGGNQGRIRTYLVSGEDRFGYNDAIVGKRPSGSNSKQFR